MAVIQPNRYLVRLIIVASLCCARSWCADANEAIGKLQAHYNAAVTLSLSFSETYSMQGHVRPPERGTLLLRKKGKMRWDYTQPAGKVFVSDGSTVYLYTAGDNRVEKIPLKDTEDMRAPFGFLLGHLDMRKEFRDFQTWPANNEDGTWLSAAAKNDRVPYSKLDMQIGRDGTVHKLNVYQQDGSEIAFDFWNEKVNPPIAERTFQFQIPPGAEVVNSVEFGSQERN